MNGVADERQVGEGLREVAKKIVAHLIDLLGEETDIVGAGEEALEQKSGVLVLAEHHIRIYQREAADQECPFFAREPIFGAITLLGIAC